jgi:alcohol sulfotransferase
MRDPKDVMVSAWLHATKNKGNFDGSLVDYVMDDRFGIVKWEVFHRNWWEKRRPKYCQPLWYEHLVTETEQQLGNTLLFLGVKFAPEYVTTVANIRLEAFQIWEKEGVLKEGPKRPKGDDTEGYYHRRGKIGGWTDYMSQELADSIDEVTKDNQWLKTKDMYSFAARAESAPPS